MTRFYFNNESCRDYGIYVSGSGTFNAPELDVTSYEIPGKNGDLVISNERYKNIDVVYPAFIRNNFKYNSDRARAWLLAPQGYCRLNDDYHPYEYRMARFKGPIDFDMRFLNLSGECNLIFDCKPQRYLTSGEQAKVFSASNTLTNPTLFPARPLITVYGTGSGTVTIGSTTVTLTGITSYVDLDCELQDAYKGTTNCNSLMSGDFPVLAPGENAVAFTGDITGLKIIPRWWTL